ncbi:hypothetical protein GGQ92_001878 [Gracilibacillus halotolerans]|uniref:Cortex morphogenetic protein CmpA n=1 Tax=Gracilibacillus halotolerans TaxID=74386 RepID=A0A841RR49_9BACI|nr:cortex morphogenetic protein CmpA [Gracilibacillus halotolerans]MBB6513088.1 hypothetical protein [Gracilibacillus halotolerans]
MPGWLRRQLSVAFHSKDKSQIKLLNQCWYYYCNHLEDERNSS